MNDGKKKHGGKNLGGKSTPTPFGPGGRVFTFIGKEGAQRTAHSHTAHELTKAKGSNVSEPGRLVFPNARLEENGSRSSCWKEQIETLASSYNKHTDAVASRNALISLAVSTCIAVADAIINVHCNSKRRR
jgi:hypothetical protein